MNRGSFLFGEIRLTYLTLGQGPEVLLAFHGFGQDSAVFKSWESCLGDRFTIFGIDLFFHGGSYWPYGDQPVDLKTLSGLLNSFLGKMEINRFSVAAYSLGAKFAMSLVGKFADRINNIFMMAPEGIRVNFWYRFATGSMLTRFLFRYTVNDPWIITFLIFCSDKLGWMHPKVLRFARSQTGEKARREQLYLSWVVFRKLKYPNRQLAHYINQSGVHLIIFLGDTDRMIMIGDVMPLVKRIPRVEVITLPSGHTRLIEETGKHLCRFLKSEGSE